MEIVHFVNPKYLFDNNSKSTCDLKQKFEYRTQTANTFIVESVNKV